MVVSGVTSCSGDDCGAGGDWEDSECVSGACFGGSRPGTAVDGMGSAMGNVVDVVAASGPYGVEGGCVGAEVGVAVGARDRALGTGRKTVAPFSGDGGECCLGQRGERLTDSAAHLIDKDLGSESIASSSRHMTPTLSSFGLALSVLMAQIDLPYGKKRKWELDTADVDIGLKSVAERCCFPSHLVHSPCLCGRSGVIAHSLRQCTYCTSLLSFTSPFSSCLAREKWMLHTFPKFTTRARGAKAPEPPPPHTIMPRGRCNLAIGPHHFRDTSFYEVHYMQSSSATPAVQTPLPSTTNTSPPSASPVSTPTTAPSDDQQLAQLKLVLGGGTEYTISADLVARIHYEASVNPIFATKFRLAVEPNATQEQIRNFAFALPHLPGVTVSGAPTSLTLSTEQQKVRLPPVREWDVVLEFNETPNERWLIPRGTLASCSRLVNKGASMLCDVSLTLRLPLSGRQPTNTAEESKDSEDEPPDSVPPQAVKFMLNQAPDPVYDLILKWIGSSDKNAANAATLAKIVSCRRFLSLPLIQVQFLQPKRPKVFPPHRIAQGALLTQLQAVSQPSDVLRVFLTCYRPKRPIIA